MDKVKRTAGQSTVEAAFLIPVLLGAVLMLVQPGIVLYDRMVMKAAAAQACRLMVTLPEGDPSGECEAFVRRRLSAVPQQDSFHVHGDTCSWEVAITGGETSQEVTVEIKNKIKPLPLIAWGGALMNLLGEDGTWDISVKESVACQPSWVQEAAEGSGPSTWIGAWLH